MHAEIESWEEGGDFTYFVGAFGRGTRGDHFHDLVNLLSSLVVLGVKGSVALHPSELNVVILGDFFDAHLGHDHLVHFEGAAVVVSTCGIEVLPEIQPFFVIVLSGWVKQTQVVKVLASHVVQLGCAGKFSLQWLTEGRKTTFDAGIGRT